MTPSQQNIPNRRRRPVESTEETLPTLFRVPAIGPEPLPNQAPPQLPDPEPTYAEPTPPEDSQLDQRVDREHSYNDLPELPPLDAPAGRSWAEAVGSRAVLALLFLAVATVAILGTRDVPPISNARDLANDPLEESNPTHIAQLDLTVDEGTIQSSTPDDLSASGAIEFPEPSNLLTEQPYVIPSASEDPATVPSSPSLEDALPSLEEIEDEPSNPSFPPLPELADESNDLPIEFNRSSPLAPHGTIDVNETPEAPVAGSVQANPLAQEAIDEDSAHDEALAELKQPVYKTTTTPDAIADWSKYYQESQTVGFQQPIAPNISAPGQSPRTHGMITDGYQQYAPAGGQMIPPYSPGAPTGQVPAAGYPAANHPTQRVGPYQPGAPQSPPAYAPQPPTYGDGVQPGAPQLQWPSGQVNQPYGVPPGLQPRSPVSPVYGQPVAPSYHPLNAQQPGVTNPTPHAPTTHHPQASYGVQMRP